MTDSSCEPESISIDSITSTTASLLALEYPTPHNRTHDAPPEPDRSSEKTAIENALKSKDTRTGKHKKPNNELLREEVPYAPMDRGRTPTSAGVDPWLAAMEKELWG